MKEILEHLAEGQSLNRRQVAQALQRIIDNTVSPTQAGAFLMGLRQKGETVEEINGFLDVLEAHMVTVELNDPNAVDVCGTGGDGTGTFNVSTAVSFVLAAGGITVAKHGNRSISSKAGSADVLTALGANIRMHPNQAKRCADEIGITFFYAPLFHPVMKAIAPHRQSLAMRTVFNMLGPLLNPAKVRRQLIGTYNFKAAEILAQVLKSRKYLHGFVVHSYDGMDEISPFSQTQVYEIIAQPPHINTFTFDQFRSSGTFDDLRGNDAQYNARKIRQIFSGKQGGDRDAVLLNAAFGFRVAGKVKTLWEGRQLAQELTDSGLANKKLNEFIQFTQAVS